MKTTLLSMAILMGVTLSSVDAGQTSLRGHVSAEIQRSHQLHQTRPADHDRMRTTTITNAAGQTAQRTIRNETDVEARTHVRTVDGSTFSGDHYSSISTTQRTATGYQRSATAVGPNGQSRSREVSAEVDRDNHTVSKDIALTGPNGETRTATVVKQYGQPAP